jgi:hypothetical protein
MQNYWSALSYGKLQLGVVANTDAAGTPVIPTIAPKDDNANAWSRPAPSRGGPTAARRPAAC